MYFIVAKHIDHEQLSRSSVEVPLAALPPCMAPLAHGCFWACIRPSLMLRYALLLSLQLGGRISSLRGCEKMINMLIQLQK